MPQRYRPGFTLLPLIALLAGCAPFLAQTTDDGAQVREPSAEAGSSDETRPLDATLAIAVFKEKRELVVLRNGVAEQSFPVQLGPSPFGHKQIRGDRRTPEGTYRICTIKPSRFLSFFWLSYPNEKDALEALEEGRLSGDEYRRIVQALESGACPPADTALGGLVGIHGDYQDPPRYYDWTEGCIAMTRKEDLMQLASLVQPGTPVVILP